MSMSFVHRYIYITLVLPNFSNADVDFSRTICNLTQKRRSTGSHGTFQGSSQDKTLGRNATVVSIVLPVRLTRFLVAAEWRLAALGRTGTGL
jgi:hypothetical protein